MKMKFKQIGRAVGNVEFRRKICVNKSSYSDRNKSFRARYIDLFSFCLYFFCEGTILIPARDNILAGPQGSWKNYAF